MHRLHQMLECFYRLVSLVCVCVRFNECNRCWRTCRSHRPLHHHPSKEHHGNCGKKWCHHGVRCQCKVCIHKKICSWREKDTKKIHRDDQISTFIPPQHLILWFKSVRKSFVWTWSKKCFAHLSFCTSPPFFPLIQGFALLSLSHTVPALNSDYYLQFKDLIRMTDVSNFTLNAL